MSYFWFYQNLKISMNTLKITVRDASLKTEKTIEVALIGDIHIFDTPEEYKKISNMLKDIDKKNPDLVIFAGDYTGSPTSISNMKKHRLKIAKLLSQSDKQKKIFVLGDICQHEGAKLNFKKDHNDKNCRAACPWHGMIISPLLILNINDNNIHKFKYLNQEFRLKMNDQIININIE